MPSWLILTAIILILSYPIVNAHLFTFFFFLTFAPEFEKQTHAGTLISMFVINVLFALSNLHILIAVFWKYIFFFGNTF